MPTLSITLDDLKCLIGKEIADEELQTVLPLNKLDVEEWGEEIRLEVTPDRPDLLSVEGAARQIRAWLGISTGLVNYPVTKPSIILKAGKVQLRPYIVCGVIRNVKMSDYLVKSLMQIQELLHLTLGRDRKKVAIGVHDLSKVNPPFVYKEIEPGSIKFVPLDFDKPMNLKEIVKKHPKGKGYAHLVTNAKKWPIIVDSKNQVLSFPPIINGELTRVTRFTKDLFIDVTGTDLSAVNYTLNILVTALAERKGKIEAVKIEKEKGSEQRPNLRPVAVRFEMDDAKKLLGLNLKKSEARELLERMGYGVLSLGKITEVLVPAYRTDILHAVDIVEDIAIAYGYNDFIPEVPKLPSVGKPNRLEEFSTSVMELMIGLGFQEVINFILTSKEKQFKMMNVREEQAIEIANPVSSEYTVCRKWLLPTLLENLAENKDKRYPQKIFELGDCLVLNPISDTKTESIKKLVCVVSHSQAGLAEILSIVNALKTNLGIDLEIQTYEHASFILGRCGKINYKNKTIGVFGEINPHVLNNWKLEKPVVAFEIDIQKIFENLK